MAYGTPTDPVGGTVITVAYAVSNLLDPIRWLRLLTGNADPPGSSYVVVSDSTTGTTWRKIPTDAIADGAVTPVKLDRAYLGTVGGLLTGDLYVTRSGGATGYLILGNNPAYFVGFDGSTLSLQATNVAVPSDLYVFRAGAPSTGYIALGNSLGHYIGFDGTNVVTEAGQVITATNIGSKTAAAAGNVTTSIGGVALAGYNAPTATNATQVGGKTPTATPAANAIPIADDSGKLDGWVTAASFSIPSGLGFWVRKAADIPAGFTRDTSLDGLIPVGAGTTFSQTFTEETSYGSSWAHQHSVPSLAVTVSSVTVTGSAVGGPSDVTGNNSASGQSAGTGTNRADSPHNHSLNGVSLAVSGSGTGSGTTATNNTGDTTWLPPMRAVVWIRKN